MLVADGGGIRGYSTLLILKDLMAKIAEEEQRISPAASSSAFPYTLNSGRQDDTSQRTSLSTSPRSTTASVQLNSSPTPVHPTHSASVNTSRSSQFLPCHYFDYIAGTSTGGFDP